MDILTGWVAGISAAAASVAAVAGLVALASAPTAPTGVGFLISGSAANVAMVAGLVSFATGLVYNRVSEARIANGYISVEDPRANAVVGWAGGISGFVGLSKGVTNLGFGLGLSAVGAGCAWAVATAEITRY